MHQMLGAHQPITQHFEEPVLRTSDRRIKIARKRAHRFFVDFEKQAVLAAEMLKNRAFGDAKHRGNVAHPRGVVTLLGKMAHGGINNPRSLAFRSRPRRACAVARGRD